MVTGKFRPISLLQLFLLGVDLCINSICDLFRVPIVVQLIIFVVQDVFIVLNILFMFLLFFGTSICQAGLIGVLLWRFRSMLLIGFIYLALSISLHIWSLSVKWDAPLAYVWTAGFLALFIAQRVGAVLHYYYYKRAVLHFADPQHTLHGKWLQKEIFGQ